MMDATKVLNKIVKTFEHTNDVAVESCDEYMVKFYLNNLEVLHD